MPKLSGELFTPAEVAELVGVEEPRLERWIDLGSLPVIRTPEGPRVRRKELIPFATPFVEPEVLDKLRHPSGPAKASALVDMRTMAPILAAEFSGELFARQSRVRPLFHYTGATTALDYILNDGTLRLSPPTGMNDPFESEPFWASFRSGEPDGQLDRKDVAVMAARTSDLLRARCRLACLTRSGP